MKCRVCDVLIFGAVLMMCVSVSARADIIDPTEVPNLVLWLDAGQGLTESGGSVSVWADQSSVGNNMTQGTANRQPTLVTNAVNGLPAISFETDGSDNDYLANSSLQLDKTSTAFYVINPDSLPAGSGQRFAGHYSNGQFRFNSDKASMWTNNGNADLGSPLSTAGQFQIISYRLSSSVQIGINDPNLVTTQTSASIDNSDFLVGGVPNTYVSGNFGSFDGDFAEVVVFDRILTDGEVNSVGNYLAGKYAITSSFTPSDDIRSVYNFEGLNATTYKGTPLIGQDNWTGPTSNTGTYARTDDSNLDGQSGFGDSDDQMQRQNDENFSFSIYDGTTFTFEFDARVGTARNMEVGLITSDGSVAFQVGGQGTQLDAWRFRDAQWDSTTSTNLFPTVSSDYYHLLLEVDLAANNGDGAASLFVRDLNGTSALTAVTGLQNIDMDLGLIDGSDLTGLYFRAASGGGVDNIVITAPVPEPSSLALAAFGLVGLIVFGRLRKTRTGLITVL